MALPISVEEIFNDFKSRRAGIVRALTDDVNEFYLQCAPGEDTLCLFGLPDETWKVKPPEEEVPPELPDPAIGINFARDGMPKKEWLSVVAIHSDCWLLSVAFYFGARYGFGKSERSRLFQMINDNRTVYEEFARRAVIPVKKQAVTRNNRSTSKSQQLEPVPNVVTDVDEEEEDKQERSFCGTCGEEYEKGEFWIACDVCQVWFHGKCVNITPEEAEDINQYECPTCRSNKKQRTTLCKACGNKYGTDEFWIDCHTCKGWFHGRCVRITPSQAERIKHYKCPNCSNKKF